MEAIFTLVFNHIFNDSKYSEFSLKAILNELKINLILPTLHSTEIKIE